MKLKRFDIFLIICAACLIVFMLVGFPYNEFRWRALSAIGQYGPTKTPKPPPPPDSSGNPPPQPVDSDQDGLTDDVDGCPFSAGPAENGGCPYGDQDEDGFTDNLDVCPNQYAPQPYSTNGCAPPLIDLPVDGPCVVTTQTSVNNVNVRAQPDLSSEVVGSLLANQTPVYVLDQNEAGDWYQISLDGPPDYAETAWVATWVVRAGGDCTQIGADLPGGKPVEAGITAIDVNVVFAACTDLLLDLQLLPVHIVLDLASQANPCDVALETLFQASFGPPEFDGLNANGLRGMISECAAEAAALDRFLERLESYRPDLAVKIRDTATPAMRCILGTAVLEERLLPVDAIAIVPRDALLSVRWALTVQDMHDIGATQCLGMRGKDNDVLAAVARHLDLLTTPEELRATQFMCQVVQDVWYLGDMIPAQLALYEKLRQECGYDLSNALVVVVFATDLDSDILWAIAQPDFCEAPYGYLLADTTPVDQQADDDRIPPVFELCAPTARSLLRNHELISLAVLLRIFLAPVPCDAAADTMWFNDISGLYVSCMPNESTMNLADGTVLTDESTWAEKVAVLSLPLDAIEGLCLQPDQPLDTTGPETPTETGEPGDNTSVMFINTQGTPPENVDPAALDTSDASLQEYGFQRPEALPESLAYAVMVGQSDTNAADLYLLRAGELKQLTDTPEAEGVPALHPQTGLVAMVSTSATGPAALKVLDPDRQTTVTLFESTSNLSVGQNPLAWSPDGVTLLVTLLDPGGAPSIYSFDLSRFPRVGEPELLVPDASAPAYAPNGRFLAFERMVGDTNAIFVMTLSSRYANPVTDTSQPTSCHSPAFSKNSVNLFFTCGVETQATLYRYGVGGIAEVPTGLTSVYQPAPGPGLGYIGFDDGTAVYFGADDGSDVALMLSMQGVRLSDLSWPALRGD